MSSLLFNLAVTTQHYGIALNYIFDRRNINFDTIKETYAIYEWFSCCCKKMLKRFAVFLARLSPLGEE